MLRKEWEQLFKGDVIKNYDQIVASMGHGMSSNNARFCDELKNIIRDLFR